MASETGARWLGAILLYFVIMTFIVALISQTADTTIDSTADSTSRCFQQREIWAPFNNEPIDISGSGTLESNFYRSHILCGKSIGVLSEDICEEITGCSWLDDPNWWQTLMQMSGEATCTGQMNYSFMNETKTYLLLGTVIDDYIDEDGETTNDICTHPSVKYNEDLCKTLSCKWLTPASEEFDANSIELNINMVSKVWTVTKEMVTFQFDFGFDDEATNDILYFLIFLLPLIGLALAIYVMVRG